MSEGYWTHEIDGVTYVMPPEVSQEIPEDYRSDLPAYYTEHAIGHVYQRRAYSFWEIAECSVGKDSDIIQVVRALAQAEMASGL